MTIYDQCMTMFQGVSLLLKTWMRDFVPQEEEEEEEKTKRRI